MNLIPAVANSVGGIALDLTNSHIYWLEASGKVRRANLDGTGVQDLVTGVTEGRGIALDLTDNHIYWTEAGSSKIRRANLDGTGVQDLITGIGQGEGIALEFGASESSSSSSEEIRYVPFKSQYVLMALMALLGAWLFLRRS